MNDTLDILRQRIELRHAKAVAALEARHQAALRTLSAVAGNEPALAALKALFAYLDESGTDSTGDLSILADLPTTAPPVTPPASTNGHHDREESAPTRRRRRARSIRTKVLETLCGEWRSVHRMAALTGFEVKQVRGVLNASASRRLLEVREGPEGVKEYRIREGMVAEYQKT